MCYLFLAKFVSYLTTKKEDDDSSNVIDKTNDINKLLAEHQENQEKIANEMVKSVRSIKENSLLASKMIKSDNQVFK